MKKILNKPLEEMTSAELEILRMELDWIRSDGVTLNLDACIHMIQECIEVELAKRDC